MASKNSKVSKNPKAEQQSPGLVLSIAMGLAIMLGVTGLVYGLAAGPIYLLAQIHPDGLDVPIFQKLLIVMIGVSLFCGLIAGIGTGRWYFHRDLATEQHRRSSFLDR